MKSKLIAALLLGTATLIAGPVGCKMAGADVAAVAGTGIGIDPAAMDKTISPGDDFYGYANGEWMKKTQIPADRSSVGGFWIADQTTEKNLSGLIAEIVKSDPEAGSDAARVKNFYQAYLDTAAIDKAGMAPIQPDLQRIAAVKDKAALAAMMGGNLRADVDPLNSTNFFTENLFGAFVTQALAGGEVVPYILQGGLGMPEREYYLSSDDAMAGHQAAYRKYIGDVLTAAGVPDPAGKAKVIYDLEVKIAKAHASREESDDWATAKQLWTQEDFASKAPGLDWKAFFAAADLGDQKLFDAYHPGAIPKLAALVAAEPLDSWKAWMTFHAINQNADVLPSKIDQLHFGFYGTELSGTPEQRSRDKRALNALNAHLGDALGRLYVEKYFPASSKDQVRAMVDNIKVAFGARIRAIDWMASGTKQEAIQKVQGMSVGIGYPDVWTDYDGYSADPANAYANLRAAEKLRYTQQIAKIGSPQDKGEWWMNAQLVNAVNLPVQNALNFPAAILQKPFFDPTADAAYNYGAIGAVIGHEISHSFDNNGAAFDATGTMRNWWTKQDLAKFNEAGTALAKQYSAYEPFPGLHVKGDLTLGENIADVAGLAAAYDAYRASLGSKEAPVIGGFTGDQRFFIGYAQTWATKMRDEALRQRIATDGHAPGMYRALTVRNLDAWYKAFDVKPGDKLYLAPEDRVKIW